jgi:spermidine synthase
MEMHHEYSPQCESFLWIQTLVNGVAGTLIRVKQCLYNGASPFQKIEVFDTYAFGRVLCLAGTIVFTERDEHIYHEMITHPGLVGHPSPRRICIIGGGDGGTLREVLKHPVVEMVSVVDIDVTVKQVTEQFFPEMAAGFGDRRTTITIDDGAEFLKKSEGTYDVIIVDSFDPGGPVQSLETEHFFELVAGSLDVNGIAVIQTDSPTTRPSVVRGTRSIVSAYFAQCRPYICTIPSFPESVCSFLLCHRDGEGRGPDLDLGAVKALTRSCRYYNPDVHQGAFLLPEHIRQIVTP